MKLNLFTYNQNYTPSFGIREKKISKSEMENLIAQNKTNREIAAQYRLSTPYIRELRQVYGLPCERQPFPIEEILNFVKEGKTDKEISEITGLSYSYASNLRRRLKLPPQSTAIPKSKIEPLVNAGKTNSEAAQILGISLKWYNTLKRRYGLTRQQKPLNIDEVKALILQGKSDTEISEHFGGGRLRRISEIRKGLGIKYKFVKRTDKNVIETLKQLAAQGKSATEASAIIGKCPSWTSILYKKLKLGLPKTLKKKEQIESLFKEGKSIKEIANILKMTTSGIYYYIKMIKK